MSVTELDLMMGRAPANDDGNGDSDGDSFDDQSDVPPSGSNTFGVALD